MIRSWDGESFSYLGLGDLFIPGLLFAFVFSFQYYLDYFSEKENQSNGVFSLLLLFSCSDEESVLIESNSTSLIPLPCRWQSLLWLIAFEHVIQLFTRRNYVTDVMIGNFAGLVLSFLAVVIFQRAQVSYVNDSNRIAGASLSCSLYTDSCSHPSKKERPFALSLAWSCEYQYVFFCSISLLLVHQTMAWSV